MNSRLVVFTSQDIGFQFVSHLATRRDLDVLVVADRTDRDDQYGYRSAIDACEAAGIPCIRAARIDKGVLDRVGAHRPDLVMTVYYPHIVPPALLALSRIAPVNIHPGILPDYRGRYPVPWYILNGAEAFGLAIHRLDDGIDTGDVLVQATYPIAAHETGHALYRRTMDLGAALLAANLDALLADSLPAHPQQGTGSYYSRIDRRWQIDWNAGREAIARRVRVHARPYFPAFTWLFNRMVSVNRVSLADPADYRAQGGGRIISVATDGSLVVSCADGCLRIEEYEVCPAWHPNEAALTLRPGARFGD